jgi:hypothetical protein
MANVAITLDHTVWEAYFNRLMGVAHEPPSGAVLTACKAGIATAVTAIQAADAAYVIPGQKDRLTVQFAPR